MKSFIISIFVLFLSISYVELRDIQKGSHDWDLLIFTQQWPETVCDEWMHLNSSHSCVMPKKQDTWSIHGVWPTKLGTKGPMFCNRTWLFDPEKIKPIETDLINVWTNIEEDTSFYSFWAHEWNKHGTCAAVLEPFNSEFKYFSEGLNMLKLYDMTKILADADIVPDDTNEYKITDVYGAVKNKLNVNPSIRCRKIDGKSYLVEIRICFDKNLNLSNCDGTSYSKIIGNHNIITNCDSHGGILYPHTKPPPKSIYVQLYKLVTWLQWFTL